MAVRRISDLPNLDSYYPDASLNDCLMEVSYANPSNPNRYQSFYKPVQSLVNAIRGSLMGATSPQLNAMRFSSTQSNASTSIRPNDAASSFTWP
jgi:hypothetical protein